MNIRPMILGLCALVCGCGTGGYVFTPDVPEGTAIPISICFVREGDLMPETLWMPSRENLSPEDLKKALADWETKRPWVERQITPDLVRALSARAWPEMNGYKSVPPLSKVKFRPAAYHDFGDGHRLVLLEGTIDTLRPQTRTFTRWLKIYLVCDINPDVDPRRVTRATITIEGQWLD